jgi:hypothetical protein
MESIAWGYNWATLSLGDINTGTGSSRLGVCARLATLLCRKITVTKSKERNTGCNVAETSKRVYNSKSVVFSMIIMMTMMMIMMMCIWFDTILLFNNFSIFACVVNIGQNPTVEFHSNASAQLFISDGSSPDSLDNFVFLFSKLDNLE